MILDEIIRKYQILKYFKDKLIEKGFNFKQLAYVIGQLELLDTLIKKESFNILNALLRKTDYRLLKRIEKGTQNLVNIIAYPDQWRLCNIKQHPEEWLNNESLIFSTEKETLVFTKNDYGQKYINNKWQ